MLELWLFPLPLHSQLGYVSLAYCLLFFLQFPDRQRYSKPSRRCFNYAVLTTLSHLLCLGSDGHICQFLLLHCTLAVIKNFYEAWGLHASIVEEFCFSFIYMGSVVLPDLLILAIIYFYVRLVISCVLLRKASPRPFLLLTSALTSGLGGLLVPLAVWSEGLLCVSEGLGVFSYFCGLMSLPWRKTHFD